MASPLISPEKILRSKISRFTKANQELARILEATDWPLVTDYELFRLVQRLYRGGKKLNLRHDHASVDDSRRLRRQLRNLNVLGSDPNYTTFASRILINSDRPAEEVCCLVDPFCYVSHLSAMQRYGLTNRRPEALLLTVPGPRAGKSLVIEKMKDDHGGNVMSRLDEIVPLRIVHHPTTVRKRRIEEYRTNYTGEWIQVRGNLTRIATIGQTFLDMLDEPARCGGMVHVLETWREHARTYLDEIIPMIDHARTGITKVRAGYILTELLGLDDSRVTAWKNFAMRGGSRVLDPSKPYAPTYSEDWMISINV
jgi:predicted transcriptional regulator of viral defense system